MIAAAKELEPGTRAMLLYAEGLFRLDVTLQADTLRIIVRNLSSGAMETRSPLGGYPGEHLLWGEAFAYGPSHATIAFTLGERPDRVDVKADIATLHFHDRGTIRVSAQAIVREAPQTPS